MTIITDIRNMSEDCISHNSQLITNDEPVSQCLHGSLVDQCCEKVLVANVPELYCTHRATKIVLDPLLLHLPASLHTITGSFGHIPGQEW